MMRQEEQIMEVAFAQLELHTGIHAEWSYQPKEVDGEADFIIEGRHLRTYFEVKRELRQYQLDKLLDQARRHQPFMVIAEHIFPTIKERLRAEKIAYLDTAGNVFIHTEGTYLWIEGHKALKKAKVVTNRAFTKAGLKVVFYLLHEREAINMPYRQLAERTGVALGNIQNVLEGLKNAGFILHSDKQRKLLHNKKALLNRWIDGYRETLKPALHLGNYRFWDKDAIHHWEKLVFPDQIIAAWGGEPAAAALTNYFNPQELTIYTNGKSALVPLWRLIPNEKGELHIY
ncbi:MAG: hypothetical protein EBZ77_00975, partial [Chitinophagia bacterium]|nr:hypothetical protein [Chitinophagia bacterium]